MKIHHLNCGSLCPLSHPILNRAMPELDRFNLVCHCLLIEGSDGLTLVDTGLGLQDVRNFERFKSNFRFNQIAKPKLDLEETAFIQITKMGFNPKDVKNIIVTHFDSDHIGGLADFPDATIHVHKVEWEAAQNPRSLKEKARYLKLRWEQNRDVKTYESDGDLWHGLKRVQNLEDIDKSIYLVSLPGHTRGHAGVLIEGTDEIFFAGDAFVNEIQLKKDKAPLPIQLYNQLTHEDPLLAEKTLSNLKDLKIQKPDLNLFCSHDLHQFKQFFKEKK
jgi:glyoxylase-like metal-dependent hydrolase (beta-lactamase superfamily II)